MDITLWLQLLTYAFVLLIIVMFLSRLAKYTQLPVHLRWELYPLAGEKHRPWGGSYLEETEWWNKPREEKSFINEIKFMGEEVLYFKEYFHLNRPYWYSVYPFHIGAFLFIGFIGLLIVGALTVIGGITVSGSSPELWGQIVFYATIIVGGISYIFGTAGAISLLARRLFNKDLNPYTRRAEHANAVMILVLFLTGLVSWAVFDPGFMMARGYLVGLFTFSPTIGIQPLLVAHILLILIIASYLPSTNMMHFFAKWFTYHKIRWDDAPNVHGGGLEKKLQPAFGQSISWSAPHIQEFQRWSDIVPKETVEHLTPRVKKGDTK
ncbi:respiratory nitrate reductase subunit gamma [Chloroflexota bacterium]